MTKDKANDFCSAWLATWTGNHPEALIQYYDEFAYYQDPANPKGLKGKDNIFQYFKKLLAKNPNWIWQATAVYAHDQGFTFKWKATIPLGETTLTEFGMDIVEIENGKITRNEVYFDPSRLK